MVRNARTRRSHVHSAHNNLLGVAHAIERAEASLGFDPAARQRLHVEREEDDAVERWMASYPPTPPVAPSPPRKPHPKPTTPPGDPLEAWQRGETEEPA